MNAVRAPWSHASFLAYLGGITILIAVSVFLSVESGEHGAAGLVGWSALAFAVLTVLAFASRRNGRLVTAGLDVLSALVPFGGLLWFCPKGDFDWIVVGVAALVYILLGDRLLRSSWVVLAAWGLLQVTTHFAERWADVRFFAFFPVGFFFFPFFGFSSSGPSDQHTWAAPLVYAVLGLVFIVIAQLLARRRRGAIPA